MSEPRFLQVEFWKGECRITHGFGTRQPGDKKPSRMDWKGKTVSAGGEIFPLLSLRQVHGDRVVYSDGNLQKAEDFWQMEGDALITRTPGIALGVFTADCLPILLYDPIGKAAGIVHAGWRGSARGISRKAVEKMKELFQTRSSDLWAALGPCIGPCCYEVDEPVRRAFSSEDIPWDLISRPRGKGKWMLDLYEANRFLLEGAGILKEKIQALKICTSCRADAFYSYRNADKIGGRQLNFIALRKDSEVPPG
jgi:hypothetical protein